jgi:hypothetical protein
LRALGYETRKAARDTFYQRTRALYDFDVEKDRTAILQSLLLMTFWYEDPNDLRNSWYWSGVAASLVHVLKLSERALSQDLEARRARRIWWSCFMRDAAVSVALRRPMRLMRFRNSVPMLTLEDFNTAKDGRTTEEERDLAIICIEMAELSVCILHILVVDDVSTEEDFEQKCQSCDEELTSWFEHLPKELSDESTWQFPGENGAKFSATTAANRTLLLMTYYAAVNALHFPQILLGQGSTGDRKLKLQKHSAKVTSAAQKASYLAGLATKYGFVRYLSFQTYVGRFPFIFAPWRRATASKMLTVNAL